MKLNRDIVIAFIAGIVVTLALTRVELFTVRLGARPSSSHIELDEADLLVMLNNIKPTGVPKFVKFPRTLSIIFSRFLREFLAQNANGPLSPLFALRGNPKITSQTQYIDEVGNVLLRKRPGFYAKPAPTPATKQLIKDGGAATNSVGFREARPAATKQRN